MAMQEASTSRTYDIWASVYDHSFGALIRRRQQRAVEQFDLRPGDRVLDIGVGTGLTLHYYPSDVRVVGMDLSGGMLEKAAVRCRELHLDHCRLVRADAMLPPFAPVSFDHIMISHTISVVSDPARLLRWATTLLKPGGRIVLLNHFQSTNKLVAFFERLFNPVFMKLGWRSDLLLEDALAGVELSVEYSFQLRTGDLWKIVVLSHREPPTTRSAPAAIEPDSPVPSLPRQVMGH